MSIVMLERAAGALGPLLDEVVFVGGATVVLWLSDPAAPPARPTKDVDVVAEVTTRGALHRFEARLRQRGFREDTESGVMCRWRTRWGGEEDLLVDVMPAEAGLLGFDNEWQRRGLASAFSHTLPSGTVIRAITPPFLVATKLEAWTGRGEGDHLRSHDLEDIVTLADGRRELAAEVAESPPELRRFVATHIQELLGEPRFLDALDGFGFASGVGSELRVAEVLLPRLRSIAAL